MSRYFRLLVFSWISFPQALIIPLGPFQFFFEISRRYSQLKVHHRWHMEKIFKYKSSYYFVWTPLGVEITYRYIFAFKFTLRSQQPDIVPITCHQCQWHGCQICRWCRRYRWQLATGVVDIGGKFAACIIDTGGKFATGVIDTGGAPWLANISMNFWKTSKQSYWDTLGLGGNWFMKKTGSKKSCDTVPLRIFYDFTIVAVVNTVNERV